MQHYPTHAICHVMVLPFSAIAANLPGDQINVKVRLGNEGAVLVGCVDLNSEERLDCLRLSEISPRDIKTSYFVAETSLPGIWQKLILRMELSRCQWQTQLGLAYLVLVSCTKEILHSNVLI